MTIIVLSYKIFIGGDANGQRKKKILIWPLLNLLCNNTIC